MKLITAGDLAQLEAVPPGTLPVLLYAKRGSLPGGGTIGNGLSAAIRALPAQPSEIAFDLLTIALSVIAADTFVQREKAPDAWTRSIDLVVRVANPAPWQAHIPAMEQAFRFLSGDIWKLSVVGGGPICPVVAPRFSQEDCVCLFSGGLDSTLGAIKFVAEGRHPLLVSQASPQEQSPQITLASVFGRQLHHFRPNADPKGLGKNETSTRPRSFLFLAYGILAASALANSGRQIPIDVFIPENGLIALNAPLTRRRLGSHSTRTTHPWFLATMQKLVDSLSIPVRIDNPFQFMTKGEMMATSPADQLLALHAKETLSCGKMKRHHSQCGRCVPCLIRRAAFHHAQIPDHTGYRPPDLLTVKNTGKDHDDLLALRLAIAKLATSNLDTWVAQGGPLPEDPALRTRYLGVFQRGMEEMKAFLIAHHCYP